MTENFAPDTLFHLTDPEVSQIAAVNLDGTDTERICHIIVDLIDERGALAPWELERFYHDLRGRRGWPQAAFHTVHKRASQMKVQMAVLRGTGEKVAPPKGKAAERLGLTMHSTQAHAAITRHFDR